MGAVCLYGYYGAAAAGGCHPSTPLGYFSAAAPPFFAAHGDHDSHTPVDQSRRFAQALREVLRQPVVYAELPRAQHAFDLFDSVRFEAVVKGFEAFATRLCSARTVPHALRR